MKDNWKGSGGYKFEIMEGPGGGSKKGCFGVFLLMFLVPALGLVWYLV